ncbi:F-box and leucine-rich protein 22-like [Denticeps clupeoides]|uniref:F-box and leucine-rich protein 22-like n=1 Tax=Denticeps clupeoides TaxID=299321 RepID=UPI0010A3171F|nr:F-box and leucine-rich protein 22-like [Denticeps clupeoides]
MGRCPNLLSLTLSGCGHVTDHDIVSLLQRCGRLRRLCLENCSRLTDSTLQAVVTHGHGLAEVRLDFCRNVSQAGLQVARERRPELRLSADRSAGMIPDSLPDEKVPIRRAMQKVLLFS